MKSYSTLLALGQTFTENTSAVNTTLLPQFINDSVRTIATLRGGMWPWLEKIRTIQTVSSQDGYNLPASVRKIADLYVTIGEQVYWPELIYDPEHWKLILAMKLGESNIPRYVYQQGRKILFSPIIDVDDQPITFRSRENVIDLNAVDYTTGNVSSVSNGLTTVTGSGTSWTSAMAGRYIRITATTASGGGDELWYEIASVTSPTVLELFAPYEGTTIAAGSAAYIIGQMSVIPESYDVAPVYRAAALYWQMKNPNRAKAWWMLYDGGREAGYLSKDAPFGGLIGNMLDEAADTFEPGYISPFGRAYGIDALSSLWGQQGDASGL